MASGRMQVIARTVNAQHWADQNLLAMNLW
jgi:hypothetical protein